MEHINEDDRERRAAKIHAAVFAYFVFATLLAIACLHGLVADGATYFVSVLVWRRPTTFDHSRIFAHLLGQWPLVLALRAGVTNFPTLLYLHSFGLYYLAPLHLVLCYLFIPKEKRTDLFWPLISLFAGSINTWFIADSESLIMAFLFWPLVMFMLHGRLEQRIRLGIFLFLACMSLLSYETMVVQGLVLAGLALWRGAKTSGAAERIFWRAIAAWFLLGGGIAAYYIWDPRDINNRSGLVSGMLRFAGTGAHDLNYPALLSIGALALVTVMFLGRQFSQKTFRTSTALFATAAVFVAFAPVLMPDSLRPLQQYQARGWTASLPAGLAIAMIVLRRRNAQRSAVVFDRALIVVAVLSFSQMTWQILATVQWRGFLDVFRAELSQHEGFIPYERSPLQSQPAGIQAVKNLVWGWTNPTMSIILAPEGRVSTIFGAPPARWQPFDPQNPRELPKLADYGVDYSDYLRAIKSQ